MKKATLFAILMTCLMPCLAQEGGLEFESDVHDFGDIEQGEKVTTTFKFKNTGSNPIEIVNVSTSCGCTSAAPEKTVYQPGESGEIPVTFNSGKFNGKITKRVTITTDNEASPKQIVTIKGNVIVDIIVKPASLFFAKAESGQKEQQTIEVSTVKLDKLVITDLQTQVDYLTAELKMDGDKNATITVTADGTKYPTGKNRLNGAVTFKTNSPTMDSVRANVTINVERPVRTSPNAVYFFASKQGQQREMKVRLSSTKEKAFKIAKISCESDFIKTEVTKDEAGDKELTVTFDGSVAPPGKFMTHIKIDTDVEGQKQVVIPVRGSVQEDK